MFEDQAHKRYCAVFFMFSFTLNCMQANKVREEYSEDMSIQQAFSLVFERRPDLRFDAESFISAVSILFLDSLLTSI